MNTGKVKGIVFIVDIVWSGHIPMYHKLFVHMALEEGYKVVSCSPNPSEIILSIAENLPDKTKHLDTSQFDRKTVLQGLSYIELAQYKFCSRLAHRSRALASRLQTLSTIANWKYLKSLASKQGINQRGDVAFFFPYIEPLVHKTFDASQFDKLFDVKWSALHISSEGLKNLENDLINTQYLQMFNAKYCKGIAVLDGEIIPLLKGVTQKEIYHFPDVSDEQVLSRSTLMENILDKANGRKIISLLGVLNSKKLLLFFLKLTKIGNEKLPGYFFVCAGELQLDSWENEESSLIQEYLQTQGSNTYFYLQRLASDLEYNTIFHASTLIFSMYKKGNASSNTLTKAAIFHKPVIVTNDGGLICKTVQQYNLGFTVDPNEVDGFMEAINKYKHNEKQGFGFDDYLQLNSKEKLKQVFNIFLEKTLWS